MAAHPLGLGLAFLGRRPLASALALTVGALAGLIARLTCATLGRHLSLADPRRWLFAGLLLVTGAALVELLGRAALVVALRPDRAPGGPPPGLALPTVRVFLVIAVERAIEGTLLLAAGIALVRVGDHEGPLLLRALLAAALLTPLSLLGLLVWLAGRVAAPLAAIGRPAVAALLEGLERVVHELPTLLPVVAAITVATAPLCLAAAWLAGAATAGGAGSQALLAAASGMAAVFAAAWGGAALLAALEA